MTRKSWKRLTSTRRCLPLPGLTEEKWKSLSDLQREEMFSEYYSRREKDEEIKRLKNRKKQGARLFPHA